MLVVCSRSAAGLGEYIIRIENKMRHCTGVGQLVLTHRLIHIAHTYIYIYYKIKYIEGSPKQALEQGWNVKR